MLENISKQKNKIEDIFRQCIKSYDLLIHTGNTKCNTGTLLFKIGCGNMEKGSGKGNKDNQR